jgi:ribosomal-protein-alanine N-acetyltransferase
LEPRLVAFEASHAPTILSWVQSTRELEAWASRPDLDLEPALFEEWHGRSYVRPFLLDVGGEICAYGEIWVDDTEDEAELARILVAPKHRGVGLGRGFVLLLAKEANSFGFADVWLRVMPWNEPALACYRRAGFSRTTPEREAAFNRGMPHEYVWMLLTTRDASKVP